MGTVFSPIRVRYDKSVNQKKKRSALSWLWWVFVILTLIINSILLLTFILSMIFTIDAILNNAYLDWPVVLGITLAFSIMLNTITMFINASDNTLFSRVALFFAMAMIVIVSIAHTVLLIYFAITNSISGVGRYKTYAIIMIIFIVLSILVSIVLFVAMIIQWITAPAYEMYGVNRWFKSRHQKNKKIVENHDIENPMDYVSTKMRSRHDPNYVPLIRRRPRK